LSVEPLLSIGAFSRSSLLSIKALRFYHEVGLLIPRQVDTQTGYRSYGLDQLTDAAIIRRLRDFEVPLESIRAVLVARDPDVTRVFLEQHSAVMSDRLARTEQIVSDLQRGIGEPGVHTPAHIRSVQTFSALIIESQIDRRSYSVFLDDAFSRIFGFCMKHSVGIAGPPGAMYPSEVKDDQNEAVVAFVPIDPRSVPSSELPMGLVLRTFPACLCAVVSYTGSYDDIGRAYSGLGVWVARQHRMSGEAVRELYLVGPPVHSDPHKYVTELQWPIINPTSLQE
jgi:DNA-binding transcriptional MerR regulator/effector-binding domain-containing protein